MCYKKAVFKEEHSIGGNNINLQKFYFSFGGCCAILFLSRDSERGSRRADCLSNRSCLPGREPLFLRDSESNRLDLRYILQIPPLIGLHEGYPHHASWRAGPAAGLPGASVDRSTPFSRSSHRDAFARGGAPRFMESSRAGRAATDFASGKVTSRWERRLETI